MKKYFFLLSASTALFVAGCAGNQPYTAPTLPPQAFSALQPGMTEEQVTAMIGTPHRREISPYQGGLTCLYYMTAKYNNIGGFWSPDEQVIGFKGGRLSFTKIGIPSCS